MEKRLEGGRAGLAMLTAGILILAMFALYANSPAFAGHGELTDQGNCPEEGKVESQVDGDLDDIVLDEGTHVCIKGGGEDAVLVTADGESTLRELLGLDKNVSHYTIIEEPQVVLDDRFVCDTENFVIVTVSPEDEGYEDAFDTEQGAKDAADGCEAPATEDTTPATEDTTPATEDTTPATEDTTPATEGTTPTDTEDEVLGTVVTTTTEAPATVEDEVAGTHVLPFTGIESDHMAMLAMALLGGGILSLVGAQSIRHRRED